MSPAQAFEEPLVLLPGMNCSARLWAPLGLRDTCTPTLREPTLDAQVDRLLDELPDRFALGGLSLGAVIAMVLTRTAPERVSRLALLSTNPHAPTAQQRAGWSAQRTRLAAGATARDLQQGMLPVLLRPETLTERPDVVAATLTMADEVGEAALDAQLQLQASRVDERPGLTRLRCPTLLVAARHDALCSVERHREARSLIPRAELVVLDRAGHLSPLECPTELATALTRWRLGT